MARDPVVAVDFLGLGTSMRESEIELKMEKERGKFVKSTGFLSAVQEQSFLKDSAGDVEREFSRPRSLTGTDSSLVSGPLTFSLAQAVPWASQAGQVEELARSNLSVPAVGEKRVDELTDADVMQLSGDECRRYMMKMKKERAVSLPTANITVVTSQPTLMSRFGVEIIEEEENLGSMRGEPSIKSRLLDAPLLAHDVAGPSSSSAEMQGFGNVLPAPRQNVQAKASLGEQVPGGACPSERAVHMPEATLSPFLANQNQSLDQSSRFGSAFPNYLKMLRSTEFPQQPLQPNQSGQGSSVQTSTVSRSTGQSHLPGRPPTAQLTIFYSGMVNVYDGVPADKAQAIMLLAGSGSSWSSSVMNPPLSVSVLPSTGGMASSSNSPAHSGSASVVAGVSQAGPFTSPLVPTISIRAGLKQITGKRTPHTELPQARKASLARFLEKRKDRVRGKASYIPPIISVKKDVLSPPRVKSPSPTNGNPCTRSPSPAEADPRVYTGSRKRLSSPAERPRTYQRNGNETSCPQTQLLEMQKGHHSSSAEDQASTSASGRPGQEYFVDWRSQQCLNVSSQEQKLEGVEEDTRSAFQVVLE